MIGTKNPVKVAAVKEAFKLLKVQFKEMEVDSGVREQPFSDDETIRGAVNRATEALRTGQGDIGIGLEGGVQESEQGLFLCNWGALAQTGYPPIIAGGARILLPEEIAIKLRVGEVLGPVMDEFANQKNVGKSEGAVGIFTNGQVTRKVMFTHIVSMLIGQYEWRNTLNK